MLFLRRGVKNLVLSVIESLAFLAAEHLEDHRESRRGGLQSGKPLNLPTA